MANPFGGLGPSASSNDFGGLPRTTWRPKKRKKKQLTARQAIAIMLAAQNEPGRSFGSRLKGVGKGALGGATWTLDKLMRPSWAVTAGVSEALGGKSDIKGASNVAEAAWSGLTGKTRKGFGQILEEQGALKGHRTLRGVVGFGGDAVTDPLMLLTIASTPVTGGAATAAYASAKAAGRAVTPKIIKAAAREAGEKALKGETDDLTRELLQAGGKDFQHRLALVEHNRALEKGLTKPGHSDLLHKKSIAESMAHAEARMYDPRSLVVKFGTRKHGIQIDTRIPLLVRPGAKLAGKGIPIVSQLSDSLGRAFIPGFKNDIIKSATLSRKHIANQNALYLRDQLKLSMAGIDETMDEDTMLNALHYFEQPLKTTRGGTWKAVLPSKRRAGGFDLNPRYVDLLLKKGYLSQEEVEFVRRWHNATEWLIDTDRMAGVQVEHLGGSGRLYVPHVVKRGTGEDVPTVAQHGLLTDAGFQGKRKGAQLSVKQIKEMVAKGELPRDIETDPMKLLWRRARAGSERQADMALLNTLKESVGVRERIVDPKRVGRATARFEAATAAQEAAVRALAHAEDAYEKGTENAAARLTDVYTAARKGMQEDIRATRITARASQTKKLMDRLVEIDDRLKELRRRTPKEVPVVKGKPTGKLTWAKEGTHTYKSDEFILRKTEKGWYVYDNMGRPRRTTPFKTVPEAKKWAESHRVKGRFDEVGKAKPKVEEAPKMKPATQAGAKVRKATITATRKGMAANERKVVLKEGNDVIAEVVIHKPGQKLNWAIKNLTVHEGFHELGAARRLMKLAKERFPSLRYAAKTADAADAAPVAAKGGKVAKGAAAPVEVKTPVLSKAAEIRQLKAENEEIQKALDRLKKGRDVSPAVQAKKILLKKLDDDYKASLDEVADKASDAHKQAMKEELTVLRTANKALKDANKEVSKAGSALKKARKGRKNKAATPDLVLETKIQDEYGNKFLFPQEVANQVNRLERLVSGNDAAVEGFARSAAKWMGAWKVLVTTVNPGYRFRNTMTDFWNMWVAGVPTWAIGVYGKRAAQMMGRASKAHLRPTKENIDAFWEIMQAGNHGILSGLFAGDVQLISRMLKYQDTSAKSLFKDGHFVQGYTKIMQDFNRNAENWGRLTHYLYRRQNLGESIPEAAFRTKIAHFDYEDLTPFEQKYMKNLFPFYTWTRKNIPYQVRQILAEPGRYAAFPKLAQEMQYAAGDPNNIAPDYVENNFGIPVGDQGLYFMPQFGVSDLAVFQGPGSAAKRFAGMVNPAMKVPFEVLTNKSLFTGQPISPEKHTRVPISGRGASFLSWLPGSDVGPTQRMGPEGKNVSTPGVNPWYNYAAGQIPFARAALGIGASNQQKQRLQLLSYLGGVSTASTDPAQQRYFEAQDIMAETDRFIDQLRGEGRYPQSKRRKKSDFDKLLESLLQGNY